MTTKEATLVRTPKLAAETKNAVEEIRRLSGEIATLYRRAAKDRAAMHKASSRSHASQALDAGEALGDTLQGYASWIMTRGSHPDRQRIADELSKMTLFATIVKSAGFPEFRRYLIYLDHMRSRLVDFLSTPPTA